MKFWVIPPGKVLWPVDVLSGGKGNIKCATEAGTYKYCIQAHD